MKNKSTKFKQINIKFSKFILFIIYIPLSFQLYKTFKIDFFSEITITINKKGRHYILSKSISGVAWSYDGPMPNEIYINGVIQSEVTAIVNLTEQENNITLRWNSLVENCFAMFNEVSNISKIDVSKFDTSQVTNMFDFFRGLYLLTSLDLSNFNTSSVKRMACMFDGCSSLISLDLRNFDTSSVTDMSEMFLNCNSLIYLNLISFTEIKLSNINSMFKGASNNFIYCINETNTPTITSAIKEKSTKNDCSNICFNRFKIINIEQKICFSNCSMINESSKYQYNNECFESCPKRTKISSNYEYLCEDLICNNYYNYEGTECINEIPDGYFLNNTKPKTIDKCHFDCKTCNQKENDNNSNCLTCNNSKYLYLGNCTSDCPNGSFIDSNDNKICLCPNTKCKECNIKSLENNLCISCNDGYYPKINDTINNDSFINCYKDPEGFYLDDNMYKLCYSSCLNCYGEGTESNHNCLECRSGYFSINDTEYKNNCYQECNNYYYFDSTNQFRCTEEKKCPLAFNKFIKDKQKCIDICSNDDLFKYELKNNCFVECPENSHNSSDNIYLCECDNYYNYEGTECINEIPDGYFLNNTKPKTIDKCHFDCKTCNQKENDNNSNCLTCNNSKYLYLGNCTSDCPNGSFIDSNDNKICLCPNTKCKECNIKSLENNLCISCNDGYYPKINDTINNDSFINCYKDPEGFYLDKNEFFYKPCYDSCKKCSEYGDYKNNNCSECKLNYTFKYDFINNSNCYINCHFNYYFDNENNYICTDNEQCPDEYNKFIEEKKRCIDECSNDNIYLYEYQNKCYAECPPRTKNNNDYKCHDLNCSNYYNYNQTDCIDEIPDGYYCNNTLLKTIDKCHQDCRTCNEKETINNTNCLSCNPDKFLYYGNCVNNCVNEFYIDIKDNLAKICKCSNINCLSCPLENENLCYSCNEDYYPLYIDPSNIDPYINCYKSPEGYYLDLNEKNYKPCYSSCKSCNEKGDIKNNKCLECATNYHKINDFKNDTNCYTICQYNYYFDYDKNYYCVKECPETFNKIIEEKNKCIDDCSKDDTYKYEYKKKCYRDCPQNTKQNNYYCEIECPEDLLYEIKATQECVKNCSISDMTKKLCILNNKNGEKKRIDKKN